MFWPGHPCNGNSTLKDRIQPIQYRNWYNIIWWGLQIRQVKLCRDMMGTSPNKIGTKWGYDGMLFEEYLLVSVQETKNNGLGKWAIYAWNHCLHTFSPVNAGFFHEIIGLEKIPGDEVTSWRRLVATSQLHPAKRNKTCWSTIVWLKQCHKPSIWSFGNGLYHP